MLRFLTASLIIASVFIQCKPKHTESEQNLVNTDSLQVQLTTLTDSLKNSWQDMLAADDEKLRQVGDMLMVAGQSCPAHAAAIAGLQQRQQLLAGKRYADPHNLTAEAVDRYDAATDSLLADLAVFQDKIRTQACCGSCSGVMEEVNRLHNEGVSYRIRYDNHAKEYNALVTQQKQVLARLNPAYAALKPRQLFSLMQ